MTYIVTETCVDLKDKSCIEVCPVDCIHEATEDRMVYIDPDECIDCGACVDPCPVDAIIGAPDERWGEAVRELGSGRTESHANRLFSQPKRRSSFAVQA